VVLGGAVMESISFERVENYVKELRSPFPQNPLIVRAALGDAAGLWGALARAGQE